MEMSRNEKIAIGVGVAVGVLATAVAFWPKKASAAELPPPPPSKGDSTTWPKPAAVFSMVPGLGIDPNALPILRPAQGSTPGSTFFVFGSHPDTQKFGAYLSTYGVSSGNQTVDTPQYVPSDDIIGALAGLAGSGELVTDLNDTPADVYLIAMGAETIARNPEALKESLKYVRQAFGTRRVIWVLDAVVPPEIAEALSESKEEWVRTNDTFAQNMAVDAWKALIADSPDALAQAFPTVQGG